MENKRDKLKKKIDKIVNTVIDKAETDNNLNYFDIEIKVHQEKIGVKYTTKHQDTI